MKGKKIPFEDERRIYSEEILPKAPDIRRRFIDDESVIKDSFELLEKLGVFLLRFPSEANISGFHINKSGIDCIYINTKMSLGRQYFSCWHEYYHAIWKEEENEQNERIECRANLFAGYILMPENLIESYIIDNNININDLLFEDIINMQHYFRVSYTAVIRRLRIIYGNINNVDKLYSLSSKDRPFDLINKITSMGYSGELSKPTNNIDYPSIFLKELEENFENKRINKDKYDSIKCLLENLRNA